MFILSYLLFILKLLLSILISHKADVNKIGIKCCNLSFLVAYDRKHSKPHFHRPIRRQISEEDRRNVRRSF